MLFHEGQQEQINISIVANRAILVVIFDDRSSLGLVRLRVKRATGDIERIRIIDTVLMKSGESRQPEAGPFREITTRTSMPFQRMMTLGEKCIDQS